MSRAIWSGTIQFGLVAVPVQLLVAVRERTVGFHMLTPDGHCRLRRKLFCPDTGKEYDFKDTARGYEIAPDEYVLIEEKELKKLKPDAGKTIDISDFVSADQIDPSYFNKTYYVRPTEGGAKSFAVLLKAMADKKRAAVAKFVLRDREHLAVLRPLGPVMVLHTLFYHDEVVDPETAAPSKSPKVAPKELGMAEQLIGALAGDFDAEKYHDDYRERVEEMIKAKAEGEPVHIPSAPAPQRVVNLMDALKKSLASVEKPSRNGDGSKNGLATRNGHAGSHRSRRTPRPRRKKSARRAR